MPFTWLPILRFLHSHDLVDDRLDQRFDDGVDLRIDGLFHDPFNAGLHEGLTEKKIIKNDLKTFAGSMHMRQQCEVNQVITFFLNIFGLKQASTEATEPIHISLE